MTTVSANETDSIINVLAVTTALFGAGLVGRALGPVKKRRERERVERDTMTHLTQAVVGKPADQWGPREPGLIEQMQKLIDTFNAHVAPHD